MTRSKLELAISIMLCALLVLATLMVGVSERSATMTLVTLFIAALSVYVTDCRGSFTISPNVAALIGAAAVGMTFIWLGEADRHGQMIALANLQSYMQYVLLFHAKTARVYWQLALLSLGQVAIASTLAPGPIFGAMLLLYAFVGIAVLALSLLHFQSLRFAAKTPATAPRGPMSHSARPALELSGAAAPTTWAQAQQLFGQAAMILACSVPLMLLLFVALPRWTVLERQVAANDTRTVGFTKTVTLGELGDVVNNPDLVMRVQLFHGGSRIPFKLANEPLFRGAVLSRYNGQKWMQRENTSTMAMPKRVRADFVRQQLTFEPATETELFAIFPAFAMVNDARLRVNDRQEQIFRQEDLREKTLEFNLGTTGISGDRQRSILPRDADMGDRGRSLGTLAYFGNAANRDAELELKGLQEEAARIMREHDLDPEIQRVAAARVLSDHFHLSDKYRYSLDSQKRDPYLDPLEDFVTKHPRGNCEFFAGALVMMLRSQGIPARMAVGFKGGEWNDLGSYYQVQQLHAHAWVEVYLRAEDIPPGEFSEDEEPPAAWLVLDPTEGTIEAVDVVAENQILLRMRHYIDYVHMLWNNYVSGLTASRQRQGIYEPLAQGFNAAIDNLTSAEVWQVRFRAVGRSPLGVFWEWYRIHWFSWQGGFVAVAFCSLLAACYGAARGLTGLLIRLGLVADRRPAGEARVHEIYRRLAAALAQRGLVPAPSQTAYEFAQLAGGELAEQIEYRRVAHLPRRIVEAFYRVRFGGRTLDRPEADALEHALMELELALAHKSRGV